MSEAILNKIQRCLALADSSNPSEAAIALKQAKALMDKHNISDSDVLIADVEEKSIKTTTKAAPADWVQHLVTAVAKAFDCKSFVTSFGGYRRCELKFVGVGPSPTIAAYTFDVLLRQLKKHRQTYIKENLSRYTRNKSKMADAFCVGWVQQVSVKCANLNPNSHTEQKLKAYTEQKIKNLKPAKPDSTSYHDHAVQRAIRQGCELAQDVALYVPVDGDEALRIGGES